MLLDVRQKPRQSGGLNTGGKGPVSESTHTGTLPKNVLGDSLPPVMSSMSIFPKLDTRFDFRVWLQFEARLMYVEC